MKNKSATLIGIIALTLGFNSLPGAANLSGEQDESDTGGASAQTKASRANLTGASNRAAVETDRALFKQAYNAYRAGDLTTAAKITAQLQAYILYPYLLYQDLDARLEDAKEAEIVAFLDKYKDIHLSIRLRNDWLRQLAKQENWKTFIKHYQPSASIRLQCAYRQALIHTGYRQQALDNVDELWLTGRSLPKNCDPILSAWRKQGKLSRQLVWDRFELAMASGRWKLAKYLTRYLPDQDQAMALAWIDVHRRPSYILDPDKLPENEEKAAKIIVHGLKRQARYNPDLAVKLWQQQKDHVALSEENKDEIFRSIGLSYAYKHKPPALDWLSVISTEGADQRVREWRVRSAMLKEDWGKTLHWVSELKEEKSSDRWQYWHARALDNLGRTDEAKNVFDHLATRRSYEGFLAADRVKRPYQLAMHGIKFSENELLELEQQPSMQRARELLAVDQSVNARREWYQAIKGMNEQELQMAAKIAQKWNWHDRAILTVAKTSQRDDLELRFPIAHRSSVIQHASKAQIDPAWAFAMIRQESAFNTTARSSKGAMGLMQLMPKTANSVAKSLNTRLSDPTALFKADTNIRFGITYLRMKLESFDEHPVLATAAYNAGGHRVLKWLPDDKPLEADIWIETIPFTETRDYIRGIFAYTAIYESHLGKEPTPLTERLAPIQPSTEELLHGATIERKKLGNS